MKALTALLLGLWLTSLAATAAPGKAARPVDPPRPWVTAYYPIWHQQDGSLPPARIEFLRFSHLIHFAVTPAPDGTINDASLPPNSAITPAESAAVLGPAHAAGRRVLLCVGGAATAALFRPALADAVRPRFVANLIARIVARGYDGLDVDMEPLTDADAPLYEAFIRELRVALAAARPSLLLTAATASQPALFARLQDRLDQINLMAYDLSGPWPGFNTWHNAPLYDSGAERMPGGVSYPSVDGMVQSFLRAGVAPQKLGLGLAFYGDVWTGADGPRQSIGGVTATPVSYAAIMGRFYRPDRYRWDAQAQASYLSLPAAAPPDRKFISYDDPRLCAAKAAYARRLGLGGVMVWELGDGYRADQPAGRRNPLLQAVQTAWAASRGGSRAGKGE